VVFSVSPIKKACLPERPRLDGDFSCYNERDSYVNRVTLAVYSSSQPQVLSSDALATSMC
jgi:hypothetical protein